MTKRQREILEVMANKKGFIWYVDGAPGHGYNGQCWRYPALCCDKKLQRVTRVMVEKLVKAGWIWEQHGGSYQITESGKAVIN